MPSFLTCATQHLQSVAAPLSPQTPARPCPRRQTAPPTPATVSPTPTTPPECHMNRYVTPRHAPARTPPSGPLIPPPLLPLSLLSLFLSFSRSLPISLSHALCMCMRHPVCREYRGREHTHAYSLSSHTHGSDASVASGRSTVDRLDRLERIRNVSASEPYRHASPFQLSATGTNKTPASEGGGKAEEEEREEEVVPRDFANLMRRYARHTGTKP